MHLFPDSNSKVNPILEMLGEAILFSSIQFSIGSVEMSSKFSVKNFSKDQHTLDNAANSLSDYLKIAILWSIGVIILLASKYKLIGCIVGIISNLIVTLWIYLSYMSAFREVVRKNPGLTMPKIYLITPHVS